MYRGGEDGGANDSSGWSGYGCGGGSAGADDAGVVVVMVEMVGGIGRGDMGGR